MTSNCGCSVQTRAIGFTSNGDTSNSKVDESIAQIFKPELINRLDKVIKFNRLSEGDITGIANNALDMIIKSMGDMGIELKFSESLIKYLCNTGYSTKYGARNLHRVIQDTVENRLSDLILEEKIQTGSKVYIDCIDGCIKEKIYSV